MISFSLKRIKFTVDFSFFAVIAFLCIIDGGKNIISAFSVCLIHETGHLIPMTISGEKIKSVSICGAGIRIVPYKNPLKPIFTDIAILAGGSFFNFITGFSVILFSENISLFAAMNIIIGIFNLLPYRNFDGGEIMLILMEYYGNEFIRLNAEKIVFFIGIITSLMIISAAYSYGIINLTLIFTLIYLNISST